MLSGETAIGEYPFEAAAAATRIAEAVEARAAEFRVVGSRRADTPGEAAAVAHAVADVASSEAEIVAITCYTETGRTARLLSAERPSCPIYAFIPEAGVRRVSARTGASTPFAAERPADTDEMIATMDRGLAAARASHGPGSPWSWRRRPPPAARRRTC